MVLIDHWNSALQLRRICAARSLSSAEGLQPRTYRPCISPREHRTLFPLLRHRLTETRHNSTDERLFQPRPRNPLKRFIQRLRSSHENADVLAHQITSTGIILDGLSTVPSLCEAMRLSLHLRTLLRAPRRAARVRPDPERR